MVNSCRGDELGVTPANMLCRCHPGQRHPGLMQELPTAGPSAGEWYRHPRAARPNPRVMQECRPHAVSPYGLPPSRPGIVRMQRQG